jgi:hypothetical protein
MARTAAEYGPGIGDGLGDVDELDPDVVEAADAPLAV